MNTWIARLFIPRFASLRGSNSTHCFVNGLAGGLVILLLLAVQAPLFAATYYVAKTGNDNNAGSESAPWLSVQKAANTMVAGDTVYIAAGIYAERVIEKTSGTGSLHITYQGVSVDTVTIGGFYISGAYVDVKNLTLNGANVDIRDGCIHLANGGNSCTFANITITGSPGIDLGPAAVNMDYYPGPANCTFDNIRITNPKFHAINLTNRGHIIRNCAITGTTGWDVFRILASDVLISHNVISVSNPGDANPNHSDIFQTFGVNLDVSRNVIIEGNVVGNGQGYQLGNMEDNQLNGDISYWTFRNNVFANLSRTLNLFVPNVSFLNNTFYRSGVDSGFAIIWGNTRAGAANNLTILNNIFLECGYAYRANAGWYAGDAVTGLVADYNLVIGTGAGTTKDGFQSGGLEVHGINGRDPALVNPALMDFRLKANSPAIGAGIALNSLFTTDLVGTVRGTVWDIGAFEYGAMVTPPKAPTGLRVLPPVPEW